jgi:hypothetical protein
MPATAAHEPDDRTGDAAWTAGAWALMLSFLAWLWVA